MAQFFSHCRVRGGYAGVATYVRSHLCPSAAQEGITGASERGCPCPWGRLLAPPLPRDALTTEAPSPLYPGILVPKGDPSLSSLPPLPVESDADADDTGAPGFSLSFNGQDDSDDDSDDDDDDRGGGAAGRGGGAPGALDGGAAEAEEGEAAAEEPRLLSAKELTEIDSEGCRGGGFSLLILGAAHVYPPPCAHAPHAVVNPVPCVSAAAAW